MRYAVIGGDKRFAHLACMLDESGRETAGFFQEKAGGDALVPEELGNYSCIISRWPMAFPEAGEDVQSGQVLEMLAPGSVLLLCGPEFPKKRRWDLQYVNLWADEELLRENAWLTARAAVAIAMQRAGGCLRGMNCMIVGCGRIGKALRSILQNLEANVTTISSSANKRAEAQAEGARAGSLQELPQLLPGQKVIFSTPPAAVLNRDVLIHADSDAMIMDLASPPYGVDLEAAAELGLQAWREPGLPGRWCPLSAARAIYNAVLRWEEANRNV